MGRPTLNVLLVLARFERKGIAGRHRGRPPASPQVRLTLPFGELLREGGAHRGSGVEKAGVLLAQVLSSSVSVDVEPEAGTGQEIDH